ncbi:hypothetical protein QYE76_045515 [Lolium multiflorum]|uniref:Uncharacterized protein n=1 Tax=Lolium multiflorum TaxID=4521 RepID=A0AAD8TN31_LOLMU|nr:hypothetical protein QYE76_045515 [Lolium multiflorum]
MDAEDWLMDTERKLRTVGCNDEENISLSRYAPEEVNFDEKRKKRFMKGMNPYMKMQLRLARTAEFQELIDSAITFEDDYR